VISEPARHDATDTPGRDDGGRGEGDIQGVLSTGITAVAENQSDSAPSSATQIQSSMRQRRGSGT
jgi:hypothetical protein